jgi:hypothetical protein
VGVVCTKQESRQSAQAGTEHSEGRDGVCCTVYSARRRRLQHTDGQACARKFHAHARTSGRERPMRCARCATFGSSDSRLQLCMQPWPGRSLSAALAVNYAIEGHPTVADCISRARGEHAPIAIVTVPWHGRWTLGAGLWRSRHGRPNW